MIYLMHISAAMPVAAAPPPGSPGLVADMASGRVLGSLAFSEAGSRSHFWAPVSRARRNSAGIVLDARKSWVTSAGYADVYIASTRTPGTDTVDLFAVPADCPGVEVAGAWRGMGLRGNASTPMRFAAEVPEDTRLGGEGGGMDLMLQTVLPWFNLGNASVSVGLARAAVEAAIRHTSAARLEHLDESLSSLPTVRDRLAKMSIELAMATAYLHQAAGCLAYIRIHAHTVVSVPAAVSGRRHPMFFAARACLFKRNPRAWCERESRALDRPRGKSQEWASRCRRNSCASGRVPSAPADQMA